eukprot:TRINITY_DN93471_c0_g1_i1.p1 TRINITY_DN93471_c0_g1~~TRINITY_DN93471_c0_g1_i1.p1  ORF type:complete len:346 (-),score=77.33 TRINITY_DN93471_c0_g1_i1:90-1127(-)
MASQASADAHYVLPFGYGQYEYAQGMPRTGGGLYGNGRKHKQDDDESAYTTVMLRNIPNKYTRQMLIDQLHVAGFKGRIDYLYLPVDFTNRCNVGYCFINFRTSVARQEFCRRFDGQAAKSALPGFNSQKICQITPAKWQGAEENIRRLQSGPELMAQLAAHPEWLPLLLDEKGDQEELPVQASTQRSREPLPGRLRRRPSQRPGGVASEGGGKFGALRGKGAMSGGRGPGAAAKGMRSQAMEAHYTSSRPMSSPMSAMGMRRDDIMASMAYDGGYEANYYDAGYHPQATEQAYGYGAEYYADDPYGHSWDGYQEYQNGMYSHPGYFDGGGGSAGGDRRYAEFTG